MDIWAFGENKGEQLRNLNAKPYFITRKYRSLKRKLLWNFLQNKFDIILVSEFPKSGGTWFAKMLSEVLELPFPRNNSNPNFEQSILHGHVSYNKRYHKPIYVVRDGRDVVISAYYHFLFENEWNIPEFVDKNRKKLNFENYDDIANNLPAFIKFLHYDYGESTGHMSWKQFINEWVSSEALMIKYEDLLIDAKSELIKSLAYLEKSVDSNTISTVVENNLFSKIKKNQTENYNKSFARKGISGDWKNYFNEDSKNIFKQISGDELIKLGYEVDLEW